MACRSHVPKRPDLSIAYWDSPPQSLGGVGHSDLLRLLLFCFFIDVEFRDRFDGFLNKFDSAINPKKCSTIAPPQSNQIPGCCDQAEKHKP